MPRYEVTDMTGKTIVEADRATLGPEGLTFTRANESGCITTVKIFLKWDSCRELKDIEVTLIDNYNHSSDKKQGYLCTLNHKTQEVTICLRSSSDCSELKGYLKSELDNRNLHPDEGTDIKGLVLWLDKAQDFYWDIRNKELKKEDKP